MKRLEKSQDNQMERLHKELNNVSRKVTFYSRLVWGMVLSFSIAMFMMIFGLTGVIDNFGVFVAGCVGCGLSASAFVSAFVLGSSVLEKEKKLKKQIVLIEEQYKLTEESTFEYEKPLGNGINVGSKIEQGQEKSNNIQV